MRKLAALKVAFVAFFLSITVFSWAQGPAPVAVVNPQTQVASQILQLSGTARAVRISNVSARVEGAVEQVLIDDGSRVRAGDILMVLDEKLEMTELARLRAGLDRAKAEANEAQRLVTEANRLSAASHIAATEVALRKARLATANAELNAARAQLDGQEQRLAYHKITAPFDGVVTRRIGQLGEWVTRGTAVVELVATGDTYVDVEIPQSVFSSLNANTSVEIRPDTNPGLVLPAKIAASIPVANVATRTFRLRLTAEQAGNTLPPGTSATATFYITSANDKVLTVPRDALLRNPDNSYAVFVVEGSAQSAKALRLPVEVGQTLGTEVEIISGLMANSQVVVRGNEILRHDQAVTIVQN